MIIAVNRSAHLAVKENGSISLRHVQFPWSKTTLTTLHARCALTSWDQTMQKTRATCGVQGWVETTWGTLGRTETHNDRVRAHAAIPLCTVGHATHFNVSRLTQSFCRHLNH